MGQETTERRTLTTDWMINDFPRQVKDEFMGLAKMQGKNWKGLLVHLLQGWIFENKKTIR